MLLRVLVFVCGAALMALEILGARVLAPFLGNSIFVWGALITSFMTAMSVGYWVGGRLSERVSHARVLGLVVSASGALAVLVPPIASAVLPWASTLGPRIGPLVASVLIFFAPTVLISCVSPIAVRVAARDTEGVGRTAGGLYALSTGGSILGTLVTAFWLIPAFPLDTLIVATGLLLIGMGLLVSFAPATADEDTARRPVWVGAVACVAVAGIALGASALRGEATSGAVSAAGDRVLFKKDTQYHRIVVFDRGTIRAMRFDNRRQSAIDLRDGYTSDIKYTDYLHLAFAAKPDAKRVLVLGLGGGALPLRILHDYPGVHVDAVEIDPVVVDCARRYFSLPETVNVTVGDARRYVATTKERYDIVVVDAYYSDSLPFHLATREFFAQVKGVLAPDGVVAYNIISAVEGDGSKLFRSLYRTTGELWRDRYAFPIGLASQKNPSATRNVILLVSDGGVQPVELSRRITSRLDGKLKVPGLSGFAADLYARPVPTDDVPTLSDQYAPTDALIRLD
jgi:spermidine synthase